MESSHMVRRSSRRAAVTIVLSLLVALLGAAFAPAASAATTYNVATAAELTAAIASAANGDSINVTANIVVSAEVTLNKSVTVQGNGFTISVPQPGVTSAGANNPAASAFRVFRVASPSSVTINNLAIQGGNTQGAGLYNSLGATATLIGVTISNSRNSGGGGGGIYNGGTLYLSQSSLIRNSAVYGGGFVNLGVMYIDGSSLSENRSESGAGGGGAGENQSAGVLYANNSTFSQNQSTEIGGAINNNCGNLRILNSSFTGNVAYGSTSGGAIGNNGGNVAVANSLFAYNYYRTGGSVSNPTGYVLDDFGYSSGLGVSLAYSTYQATFPASATNVGGNNQYVETSATPGTTGTNGAVPNVPILFSGGASSAITDPTTGLPIGTSVFRPFLVHGSGAYAGLALPTLAIGSWADLVPNRGTSSRFSTTLVSGLPVMGYYTKSAGTPAWVALTSTTPATNVGASGDLVTSDEVGTVRPDGTTGGTYTTAGSAQIQVSNVYSVRSITTTTGGTVTGASVYGDVYTAGTSITVTALPDSGKKFKEWKVNGVACAVATCPSAYTFAVTANTTLEPVFEALPIGQYTVTYLANGATGGSAPPIATATNPTPVTIADAGSLTKTGYWFAGWNTAANGSGTAYAALASYTGPPSLTLYAVWKASVAPVNTVAPVVTGTPTSGQTLSSTAGTWTGSPAPTLAYQWQACTTADCLGGTVTAIGTNQNTYVLTGAEVGQWVRVQVTATNGVAPDAVAASNIT
ncbi:MAG: InlB B-repeat-containing protein, partial [Actinomycetes bacterium]